MGMDSVEELSGYDDVDADQIFNGGRIEESRGSKGGMGGNSEGRRRGKKSLATRGTSRSRPKRTMGRGFSFNFRGFEDTAKMLLAISAGALVLCGIVLYLTHKMASPYNFYGAVAASIVIMALLFYTATKLIGSR